jgi:thiamine biosynthesis lipoprotein
MNPPPILPAHRTISHDAMNTTFTLRLAADPPQFEGIARECCLLIDELEGRLSRFIDTSEVFRINRLEAGETLYLSDDTYRCLRLAMRLHAETGGLFDVTQGRRIARRKAEAPAPVDAGEGRLIIHPDAAAVTCECPGRELDLGGIGKGYALDRLREILAEWEIPGGLLGAGASTLLAFGPEAWPVELAGDGEPVTLFLREQALSASGTDMQGTHIVHPARDEAGPYLSDRVWALAAAAGPSDAWATALMLMTPEQIAICLNDPHATLQAAYAELAGQVAPITPP